jgi:hypothetical protein
MAKFSTAEDIISYCGLDSNISTKTLEVSIQAFQEESIKPILGKDKYEEVDNQIKLNSLSQENRELLIGFVFPYLAWGSVFMALVPLQVKLTEKGVKVKNDANSQGGMQEFYVYKAFVGERRDAAKMRLEDYLKEENKGDSGYAGGSSLYGILKIV